nr:MAG TPA: hypothetical protein [Caudoviricetes sp.]
MTITRRGISNITQSRPVRARGLKRVSNRCQLQPWGHMAPP